MDDIMDTVLIGGFLVLWIPLTIWIFIKYKNHTTMISFNGAKGFFDGYEGMLIESAVAAAAIILIPFLLLYYVFQGIFSFISEYIWGFVIVDLILIGVTLYTYRKNPAKISKGWVGALGIFSVVILITGAMNLMAPSPKNSHSAPAQNKKTTTQPVQSNDTVKQNSGDGKTSSKSTNTNNTANAGQYYATVKTMDKQIVQFSEKLNHHLNSNASFKGTNYDAEGRNILQTIRSNRDKLNNDSSINGADKQKLLHLYDLEITRISGMVDGVASSKKGGEYLPYFKSGTSAAYEFDDAIAAYDKEH